MQFFSTRDHNRVVSASQAIAQGLSDEGGLFVPQSFPQVDVKEICALDYPEMAAAIVGQYLTDYSQEFLQEAAKATYGAAFGGKAGYLAPVSDEVYSLELWHGPTCAFKDYALQLMPKLLVEAKKNLDRTEKTLILVATSGDTGKAALDGYHDIPGVEIAVFYPTGGTSEIQRLQMATQEGANVAVYAVRGNFDDAQTGVKKVFGDKAIAAELEKRNIRLSSANSINWGRLVPQIVYYFYGYLRAVERVGEEVVFAVPGGNFGNAYACWVAKKMGLPIMRLIVCTNENDAMDEFLRTGRYAPKPSSETIATSSPSTDISRAASFERFLFDVLGRDGTRVRELAEDLKTKGEFTLTAEEFRKVRLSGVVSGSSNHPNRLEIIEQMHLEYDTYVDPHTADALFSGIYLHPVGVKTLCVETVQAVKFPRMVRQATGVAVEPPEDMADLFSRPLRKVQTPACEAAVREEIERLTERPDA
mgnify:CR=1 FL=1